MENYILEIFSGKENGIMKIEEWRELHNQPKNCENCKKVHGGINCSREERYPTCNKWEEFSLEYFLHLYPECKNKV